MKKVITKILAVLAKAIIRKYNPEVIGITGSVGKTSVKEAVYAVLSYENNVRQNYKSYNNEIGLPLTIIGEKTVAKSITKWFKVFIKAISLILFTDKEYPKILILEMGADKKNDIDYLVKIAPPKISILTSVSEAHLHVFDDIKGVLKEKSKIITALDEKGVAILNEDDENVMSLRDKVKTKIVTYGYNELADVRATELLLAGLEEDFCESLNQWDCKIWGTSFKVMYDGSTVPVFLPHCFGKHQVYAALAGIAIGVVYKMNLVDIAESLKIYKPPAGRMNLIPGIKHTMIIDDTYNSSPISVKAALDVLSSVKLSPESKRIAVLGDMLELGKRSDDAHRELGFYVGELEIDYLITVGKEAELISQAAAEAGLGSSKSKHYETAEEAGIFLQNLMQKGDMILVKGSQGVRTEKVVKEVMAEPEKAKELLVRQTGEWENK